MLRARFFFPDGRVKDLPGRRIRSFWLTVAAIAIAIVGCANAVDGAADGESAGLATHFDSTADTIVARVIGDVPAASMRTLVEELRIQPSADDTTLFSNVWEFDVDAAGRMWAFDIGATQVLLFSADGKLLRRIGRRGAGPGEFQSANVMVALPDTGLAVWDN